MTKTPTSRKNTRVPLTSRSATKKKGKGWVAPGDCSPGATQPFSDPFYFFSEKS